MSVRDWYARTEMLIYAYELFWRIFIEGVWPIRNNPQTKWNKLVVTHVSRWEGRYNIEGLYAQGFNKQGETWVRDTETLAYHLRLNELIYWGSDYVMSRPGIGHIFGKRGFLKEQYYSLFDENGRPRQVHGTKGITSNWVPQYCRDYAFRKYLGHVPTRRFDKLLAIQQMEDKYRLLFRDGHVEEFPQIGDATDRLRQLFNEACSYCGISDTTDLNTYWSWWCGNKIDEYGKERSVYRWTANGNEEGRYAGEHFWKYKGYTQVIDNGRHNVNNIGSMYSDASESNRRYINTVYIKQAVDRWQRFLNKDEVNFVLSYDINNDTGGKEKITRDLGIYQIYLPEYNSLTLDKANKLRELVLSWKDRWERDFDGWFDNNGYCIRSCQLAVQ